MREELRVREVVDAELQTLASLSRLIGNYGIVVISFVQVRNPY